MTSSSHNPLTISTPIKPYLILILFTGMTSIAYFLGFVSHALQMIKGTESFQISFLFLIFILIVSVMVFLWFTYGIEEITFHKDHLEIMHYNRVFRYTRKFSYQKINNISLVEKTYPGETWTDQKRQNILESQRAVLLWRKMGRIGFDYGSTYITLLNGLRRSQEQEMLEFIRAEVTKRRNEQKPLSHT